MTKELIQDISLTEMTKEWNKEVTSPKYEKGSHHFMQELFFFLNYQYLDTLFSLRSKA